MKIQIDEAEVLEITETDILLLEDCLMDVPSEIERRVKYPIQNKCEEIYSRLTDEWVKSGKLEELGVDSIPTNRNELINLIVGRPEYKNRVQRAAEQ